MNNQDKNIDEIEFIVAAKLGKFGLEWHTEVTHRADEISEKFKDELWDRFLLDVDKQ